MLYEPVSSIGSTSLDITNSEFYQYRANRKCKFNFQFFCPLFSSFLIYVFSYFVISFQRHCICRQHSILCLFMHLFPKFPCFHLTYIHSISELVFVFLFFTLLIFSSYHYVIISSRNFEDVCSVSNLVVCRVIK
jgi:hypothetical protein